MWMRLGEMLVQQGLLTQDQVDLILEAQREGGGPFGHLAEALCGVDAREIEAAWAHQYEQITGRVDLAKEKIDTRVIPILDGRQAWQFGIIPLRRNGGELLMATTRSHLPRAIRFVMWHLKEPVVFVMAAPEDLERALAKHYPIPGMSLKGAGDRLATPPPIAKSA